MSLSKVLTLVREIEKVIEADLYTSSDLYTKLITSDRHNISMRMTMVSNLSSVLSTFLRRESDDVLRHMNKTFPQDLADAIFYPAALTPEEVGQIIRLYGNHFEWQCEGKLNRLLDQLPGKSDFHPCAPLNWTEHVRLRMEKVPTASIVNFTTKEFEIMRRKVQGNSANWREHNGALGLKIGAFGYTETTGMTSFYFEDKDAATLAALTYY